MKIYYYSYPYKDSSNGLRLAYSFVYYLRKAGFLAWNVVSEENWEDCTYPLEFKNNVIPYQNLCIENDDIVIYPDSVDGNPFHAKNIIRHLLNRVNKKTKYDVCNYLVTYNTAIYPNLPIFYCQKDEIDLFQKLRSEKINDIEKKTRVSIYFGKSRYSVIEDNVDLIKSLKDKYSKIEIITRKYPSNHINTLRLVKNSDLLISFDALSNINYESTLLGTPVLALDDFFKIMKEVQISHYGYAFDESEIDMARLSVGKAFDEYLKIIQKQGDDFVDVIHNALAHFKRVETNLEYRKEYDKYAEECINSNPSCSFENISSLNNIPLILRKKMRINSKELSIKTEIKYILYKLGLYNCSMSLYKRLKNRTL